MTITYYNNYKPETQSAFKPPKLNPFRTTRRSKEDTYVSRDSYVTRVSHYTRHKGQS